MAADELLRAAVERQFAIAGAALGQLRRRDADTAARIVRLPEAIGLCDVLLHGYVLINDDVNGTKGWTLIGGQLVHLHCWERGSRPTGPPTTA